MRRVFFQILVITGLNCLVSAFLVRPQPVFRKSLSLCPSRNHYLLREMPWEAKKKSRLLDSANDINKENATSFAADTSTSSQAVMDIPNDTERLNQGRIYKTYQDLLSYIMKTPLWRDYSLSLTMKPIVTKSFSSMIGFFLGDILAQLIFRKAGFNFPRFLRMGAFGGLIHGPTGHLFYGFLERKFPGASTSAVVKKVTIDQLVWCPIFTLALFCFTGITAGFSPREIFAIFKISGPQVIFSSWLIWPAAHAVNFRVIPGRQRLLYINIIQLFFNSILSALANNIV